MTAASDIFFDVFPEFALGYSIDKHYGPEVKLQDQTLPHEFPRKEGYTTHADQWLLAVDRLRGLFILPAIPVPEDSSEGEIKALFWSGSKDEIESTLRVLADLTTREHSIDLRNGSAAILSQYFQREVRRHFASFVHQRALQYLNLSDAFKAIDCLNRLLRLARVVYLTPIQGFSLPSEEAKLTSPQEYLSDLVNGLFRSSLPSRRLCALWQSLFFNCGIAIFCSRNGQNPSKIDLAYSQEVSELVMAMRQINLAGDYAEKALPQAMSQVMQHYVRLHYAREWGKLSVSARLAQWIEASFMPFVHHLYILIKGPSSRLTHMELTTPDDLMDWKTMGINVLGRMRCQELFDIIDGWADERHGALEALGQFVHDANARAFLVQEFSGAVKRRLLQPSVATEQILTFYIHVIQVFTLLDTRCVLLDRVSHPIRRYLRDREDGVSLIVEGLLADPDDRSAPRSGLQELSYEMQRRGNKPASEPVRKDFDFDDLEWMPDPVDIGPEFDSSKHSDIIATIIGLFDSKEAVIAETQKVLGERLLKLPGSYHTERRLIVMLEERFGAAALQSCYVMLHDVIGSVDLDLSFAQRQRQQQSHHQIMTPQHRAPPVYHAQTLSHLFWPALHRDTFKLPPEIEQSQAEYTLFYETLRHEQKLTWLQAQGHVSVTLDLEDRSITEEVHTWQASVIYAFQPSAHLDQPRSPVSRSLAFLMAELHMPESLVQNALTFWEGKRMLKKACSEQDQGQVYTVIENLSREMTTQGNKQIRTDPTTISTISDAALAAETANSTTAPTFLSAHDAAREKMTLYAQYVVGMLTNGGPMPLQQIIMMLKLTVAGGFPLSSDDLKAYLEDRVRQGALEYINGTYKIR